MMATQKSNQHIPVADRENQVADKRGLKFPKQRPAFTDLSNNIGNAAKENIQQKPADIKKKNLNPLISELTKKIDQVCCKPQNASKITAPKRSSTAVLKREESIINLLGYSSKQLNIYDPDENTKNDPNAVTEYLEDIFNYLREMEKMLPIKKNYLEGHSTTPSMRSLLINWIVNVQISFKLCVETLHLSVSIIDRYLQDKNHVGRTTLQLVGVTALWISSKYEEICIPELSDFVYICDNCFTTQQMTSMERDILVTLKFALGRPSSIHFLRRYSKIAKVNALQHNLGKYLIELALLDYSMCHLPPSLQAAAACCLSIAVLNDEMDLTKVWTPTLIHYTKYKLQDFRPVLALYAMLLKKVENSKYKAVKEKYSRSSFGKISTNSKLAGRLIMKLSAEKSRVNNIC